MPTVPHLTGIVIAGAAIGGNTALLLGTLGAALITGGFSLAAAIVMSGMWTKHRRLNARIEELEAELRDAKERQHG